MDIIVYYPADGKGRKELMKRAAEAQSECAAAFIKKQPWTKEQKQRIIRAVKDSVI